MVKILIVDDSESNVDILREILEDSGHDIVTATTEREALKALGKTKFDKGIFDWGIETPVGQPKEYWEPVIRKAAQLGIKDILFNTYTDDTSGKLRLLKEELRSKGIRIGELNKEAPAKEFFAQVRREVG